MSKLTPSRRPGVPHHRARFTPRGREMVVRRVVEDGETFAQAAAWANVSKSTVWEWVRRWRAATPGERESLACLAERSSRPHRSPVAGAGRGGAADLRAARADGLESADDRRWPRSAGRTRPCTRCCGAAAARAAEPSERPAVVRYEWPCPGQLLHMDVKKLGKFDRARPHADRRSHPALAPGRLGVRALDRR